MPEFTSQAQDLKKRFQQLGQQDPQASMDIEAAIGGVGAAPDLPDLPGFEQFEPDDLSTGIRISRAVATFMAGLQDPTLAQAMVQQFNAQDIAAKNEAQRRYQAAANQVMAQREEIQFQTDVKMKRTEQAISIGNLKARLLEGEARALEAEIKASQDPNEKQQKIATLAEIQTLIKQEAEQQQGQRGKPPQFDSPLKAFLGGAITQEDMQFMLKPDKTPEEAAQAQQMMAQVNASIAENWIPPKIKMDEDEYYRILSIPMTPIAQQYFMNAIELAPDPLTGQFDNPGDAQDWGTNLRGLTQEHPEVNDEAVAALAQTWLSTGRVRSIQEAEEIIADAVSSGMSPEDDARLMDVGTVKRKPGMGAKPPAIKQLNPRHRRMLINKPIEQQPSFKVTLPPKKK